ncbi:MAG TPA: type I DNA topoisomerase [Nitrospiria bacterium]|nr:type I DNA topoisomerase [Nitrospiria bacterium]
MAKSLIIVESPSKAKTINKFLGKNFTVKASVGHLIDLPKSKLGINIEKNFKPEYTIIRGKKKVLDEIIEAARKADRVYLAPDPDREGEAIAWHIAEEISESLGGKKGKAKGKGKGKTKGKGKKSDNGGPPGGQKVFRVLFNEITEKAVKKAIETPSNIDMNRVNAQQARRVLDRLVGYTISPLLWDKVKRGLSAGRVQSVALRIVCEREEEISRFVAEEYWSLTAQLTGQNPPSFSAKLVSVGGKTVEIPNGDTAERLRREIENQPFIIETIEKKERKKNPVPPFTTSKIQQEASRKLRFSPKKTMMLAQQLYEGIELGEAGPVGLITYMRTDSHRVSPEVQQAALEVIAQKYGREYVPDPPNIYKSRKNIQDAHEAIRPTYLENDPEAIKGFLSRDQYVLYKLIWNRFLASQMKPAILEATRVDIRAGEAIFRANGNIVIFPGFTAVYTETREENGHDKASEPKKEAPKSEGEGKEQESDDDESQLPQMNEGDRLTLNRLEPKQHFTQPPPRFTEALLIKELEEKGIGRPSTYAAILSTIQERDYVDKAEGRLKPSELGRTVNTLLVESFPDVVNVEFTAKMEEELDEVEEGEKKWTDTVRDFYTPFEKDLARAQIEMRDVKREETPTDIPCANCGKMMVIKWGRNGRFLACPGYPECKNTSDFVEEGGKIRPIEKKVETAGACEKCGGTMIVKVGRFGRFLACSNYPDCKNTKPISLGVKCPREGCNGEATQKRSKRGRVFYGCTAYPKCDFALWDRPVARECPQCHAPFMIEKVSRLGIKIKCNNQECGFEEESAAA